MGKKTNKNDSIRIEGDVVYLGLTKGMETKFDLSDLPLIEGYYWHVHGREKYWYARSNSRHTSTSDIRMHRLIMKANDGEMVDHIDGDTLNNCKNNLRICSRAENARNRSVQKNNKTGYRGVCHSKGGRYKAVIWEDGKSKHIGTFGDKIDAAKAYNKKAEELFGEFSRLNDV